MLRSGVEPWIPHGPGPPLISERRRLERRVRRIDGAGFGGRSVEVVERCRGGKRCEPIARWVRARDRASTAVVVDGHRRLDAVRLQRHLVLRPPKRVEVLLRVPERRVTRGRILLAPLHRIPEQGVAQTACACARSQSHHRLRAIRTYDGLHLPEVVVVGGCGEKIRVRHDVWYAELVLVRDLRGLAERVRHGFRPQALRAIAHRRDPRRHRRPGGRLAGHRGGRDVSAAGGGMIEHRHDLVDRTAGLHRLAQHATQPVGRHRIGGGMGEGDRSRGRPLLADLVRKANAPARGARRAILMRRDIDGVRERVVQPRRRRVLVDGRGRNLPEVAVDIEDARGIQERIRLGDLADHLAVERTVELVGRAHRLGHIWKDSLIIRRGVERKGGQRIGDVRYQRCPVGLVEGAFDQHAGIGERQREPVLRDEVVPVVLRLLPHEPLEPPPLHVEARAVIGFRDVVRAANPVGGGVGRHDPRWARVIGLRIRRASGLRIAGR